MLLGLFLGCCNGHVALWETGKPDPVKQYPYPVALLPPADQDALQKGIPADDPLELAQLLEDFLS